MTSFNPIIQSSSSSPPFAKVEEEVEYEEEDEYDEDDYYGQPDKLPNNMEAKSSKPTTEEPQVESIDKLKKINSSPETNLRTFAQNSANQKQSTVIVNVDKSARLTQTQNGKTVNQLDEIEVEKSNPIKKEKTVSGSSSRQKVEHKARYRASNSDDQEKKTGKSRKPDSYVTVTKSLTGSLDENKQESGKFASTYYTKSSTCGFFTFSCNIVYGANGKSKICRPKESNPKC